MTYKESVEYLMALGNEVETMKLGLENIRKLLDALENPQNNFLKVQVAGTNGKGSVCAFLDSICLMARIKAGVSTSPHLVSITERVRIGGADISEDEFARIATRVLETSERLVSRGELETVPTYFEQVTAIALVAFAEAEVELAILETGLGGRFDATTAANAEICAITRIDVDHQEHLGDTLDQIAAEKAAIIGAGSKVVVGEQKEEAMEVILARCREVGVEPRMSTETTQGLKRAHALPLVFLPESLGLLGRHQVENARVALLLGETLKEYLPISTQNIIDGLRIARHPGRLEWIGRFLLDGAHNVGGAKALRAYLNEFVHRPITLIFGAMRDKNVAGMANILFTKAEKIVLTQPDNSRAITAKQLATSVPSDIAGGRVLQTLSVPEAIRVAQEISPEGAIILITGSLYLVGEARRILTRK
ncbi:MAG TPA: folylpolyglutamate synthase/dihydrofolate synthase family protein [Pyrinomonadaceae bacterium]|nr:folylpolyglutamate synthase/dihydrofolate synthase family protein [Pyrinomonadaceae bacterium]